MHVWDVATGADRTAHSLLSGEYGWAIAFSRNGDRLAIGRLDGGVDVLHLRQSPPTLHHMTADPRLAELVLPSRTVVAVAFSPDDQTVVSGTSTSVGVWDIGQLKRVRVLSGHASNVTDVAMSADGRRIYSVDTAGVVRAWPSRSTPAVVRIPGSFSTFDPFTVSADGTTITTQTSDDALTTIRLPDFHQEIFREGAGRLLQGYFVASPDGQRVFEVIGKSIRRWTKGSKETVTVSTKATHVGELSISPQGVTLAFAQGNTVTVWDASTMKQLTEVDTPCRSPEPLLPLDSREDRAHAESLTGLLFRDEETLIISTRISIGNPELVRKSLLCLWNWRTKRVLAVVDPIRVPGRQSLIRLEVSQDGKRIALISESVRESTVLGPDGRRAVTTSRGMWSTVSIWDGDLQAALGTLPPGDYWAIAFSPDGRRIVSVGAEESVVRIWDAERFEALLTLPDTDSHRGGVAFAPTGQIVAARSRGGLTIWDSQIRQR
jgi:WD40 repeat protein